MTEARFAREIYTGAYASDMGLWVPDCAGVVRLRSNLGRTYPECGGVNQSAFHWDLIKDLRAEGALFLDDRKLIEKGKFLLD